MEITIIDSTKAMIVWEPRRIVPSYAVPVEDIDAPLQPAAADATAEELAVRGRWRAGARPADRLRRATPSTVSRSTSSPRTRLPNAAFVADDPDLEGYAIIDFDAFDEWREEDELLVAHARDPFGTVDTRRSSRQVVIEINGTTIADSTRSVMLFETFLPTRYYLPRDDVRMDLLEPTDTQTACAYKGFASYWSANVDGTVVRDVAWSYEDPHNYATAVKGMISFFNERVDVSVDSVPLERPRTPWSED